MAANFSSPPYLLHGMQHDDDGDDDQARWQACRVREGSRRNGCREEDREH